MRCIGSLYYFIDQRRWFICFSSLAIDYGYLFPKLALSNPLKRFHIFLPRSRHHFLIDYNTLLPFEPFLYQPISQKLLVKAFLTTPNHVRATRPKARRIWCQCFVDQDHLVSCFVQAELELGVSNDETTGEGMLMGGCVKGERELGDARGIFGTDDFDGCFLFSLC